MFLGDVIFADVDAPADVVCGLPITAAKKNLARKEYVAKIYVEFRWKGYVGSLTRLQFSAAVLAKFEYHMIVT